MSKFLFQASYTTGGVKGLLRDGGSARREAVDQLAASVGGSVESMYFAFGEDDVYAVIDLPDHESAAALALAVASSGAVSIRTTVLLTPEQIDAAAGKSVTYNAPAG